MTEFIVYLDNTTEEQFRAWLLDRVLNKITIKTYYPADKRCIYFIVLYPFAPPNDARRISLKAKNAIQVNTPEGDVIQDLDGAIVIKWYALDNRLQVVFKYESRIYLPVILDFLEIMASVWRGTRRDIWAFVNEQVAKYNKRYEKRENFELYRLDVSHFPKPEGEAIPTPAVEEKAAYKIANPQMKPPGRHVDKWNPIAYDILNDGGEDAEKRAFAEWCLQRGIKNPSKGDREAFRKAMEREGERRTKRTK